MNDSSEITDIAEVASQGSIDHGYVLKILITVIVPLTFGLIVLVGMFGNALVIIVVATNAQMRSTTNMLISILCKVMSQ